MNLVPSDCMLCTWDSNGTCSRMDLTSDQPKLVPCDSACCIQREDRSPTKVPFWLFAVYVMMFALVVLSTLSLFVR
jgi:hypothetical protein